MKLMHSTRRPQNPPRRAQHREHEHRAELAFDRAVSGNDTDVGPVETRYQQLVDHRPEGWFVLEYAYRLPYGLRWSLPRLPLLKKRASTLAKWRAGPSFPLVEETRFDTRQIEGRPIFRPPALERGTEPRLFKVILIRTKVHRRLRARVARENDRKGVSG